MTLISYGLLIRYILSANCARFVDTGDYVISAVDVEITSSASKEVELTGDVTLTIASMETLTLRMTINTQVSTSISLSDYTRYDLAEGVDVENWIPNLNQSYTSTSTQTLESQGVRVNRTSVVNYIGAKENDSRPTVTSTRRYVRKQDVAPVEKEVHVSVSGTFVNRFNFTLTGLVWNDVLVFLETGSGAYQRCVVDNYTIVITVNEGVSTAKVSIPYPYMFYLASNTTSTHMYTVPTGTNWMPFSLGNIKART